MIRVLVAGARTLVQDLGRPGLSHLGLSRGGAADPAALRRANAYAGNPPGAAALEVLLGGLEVQALAPVVVGVAGADCGVAPVTALAAGQRLRLGTPVRGLLTYLAVAGGIDTPVVLGSRARHELGGVGPAALRPGEVLPVGRLRTWVDPLLLGPRLELPASVVVCRLHPGPREPSVEALCRSSWTVSGRVDRTAARLDGPALPRRTTEAEPEGLVLGAVQLPPDGRPIVMLADHPVTGGYPVVAVVHADDVRLVAQSRPGTTVRFVPATRQ